MLVSFFESLKYVGHLFPVAFLRVYMGYTFFAQALEHVRGDFLTQPRLAAVINEWLPRNSAPLWYSELLESVVVPHWQIFAYIIVYCEFIIGISFVVGFLVRPAALLGIFLAINMVYASGEAYTVIYQTYLALFITMLWLGAGRCLGFDYFFFKRQRGIWW